MYVWYIHIYIYIYMYIYVHPCFCLNSFCRCGRVAEHLQTQGHMICHQVGLVLMDTADTITNSYHTQTIKQPVLLEEQADFGSWGKMTPLAWNCHMVRASSIRDIFIYFGLLAVEGWSFDHHHLPLEVPGQTYCNTCIIYYYILDISILWFIIVTNHKQLEIPADIVKIS